MRGPPFGGGRAGHTTSSASSGIAGCDGVAKELVLRGVLPVDFGDDLAVAHHENAGADADELFELGRDDEDARPDLARSLMIR